ncbi:enoyl-CoA hydratase-related protein [Streptacidiphilus monticola]|uniref:Enoyl-CoA hydratase-related protein n=1 Tax=Streptacidiphilus monticola TaxID=2161674 RepID=A0ABW1G4N3_9ACTN
MRILLIASAFNSLTQRVQAELGDRGHRLAFACVAGAEDVRRAVRAHDPQLVLAPMLTAVVPEDVWSRWVCLIVHPGPPGDRGPASLDWAVLEGRRRWGVTVLQAEAEMDAGPVWASAEFALPAVAKSDVYRGELSDAAMAAVHLAVERFATGRHRPWRQQAGQARPTVRQEDRRIDWSAQPTAEILRTLRAADSRPGVLDEFLGGAWYLHGGHPEDRLRGRPGRVLATRAGAVCRGTVDGAVWIPELRPRPAPGGEATFRLPAVQALGTALPRVREIPAPWVLRGPEHKTTWRDIEYHEQGAVGLLRFRFPAGAMSTAQCRRLLAAYRFACGRPTSVLVLGPERDFFGNGIHLNVIEAAEDPGAESWANINAIDDLVEAVLTTEDRLVVAAVPGNAAAGGVILAAAADEVWCRSGAVLNPHYRLMGLYGSEYWTYVLPRRVGADRARALTAEAVPLSAAAAVRMGLADRLVPAGPGEFPAAVARMAAELAADPETAARIGAKKAARERDEAVKPLAAYRAEELAIMRRIFADPDADYHRLRADFVRKRPGARQ